MRAAHAAAGLGFRSIIYAVVIYAIFVFVFISGVGVQRCGVFVIFIFLLISSVGVQHRDEFIPTLRSEGPQWGPVNLICLCLYLSDCLRCALVIKARGP